MRGWEVKQLGDALKLEYGKPLPEEDRDDDGAYPAYGANGVKCQTNKFFFGKPSIIVGRKGSAGEITLTEEKFWPLDVTYFVTFDERRYDLMFLYHCLKSLQLTRLAKGVKPGLNRNEVYRIEFAFPPLSEQKRIVAILDEAFEGIDTAVANTEKNLANARELFESSLDLAVSGNLTRDWRRAHPNTRNASLHLRESLAERRSHWKGTGRYQEPDVPVTTKQIDIPKSWVVASPEQIATHIVDCPHTTPNWAKSGVLCLRTTNFTPGFLDLESVRFVSEETYKERIMRLEPKPGDVLYSREGGILGIACIIPNELRTCLGQRMMLFRVDTKVALPEYFTGVLNSTLILSEVKRLTGGAASPHLNIGDIRTFPIPLPPIDEQHQIVTELKRISAETLRLQAIYQQKLHALTDLKQAILHKAFAGKLTARPEKALQEAAAA
jgi:type I restriction enzyme S subunit